MMALLNLGSVVLGLIAWILPIINIIKYKKQNNGKWATLSITSMGACATSIYFQILNNNHLVNIEDWTAIMDTIGALVFVSSVLIGVTMVLNVITLFIYRDSVVK